MKLCVDCRHFRRGTKFDRSWYLCAHRTEGDPQPEISPVTGEMIHPRLKACGSERRETWNCGPDGDYWEEKPPVSLPQDWNDEQKAVKRRPWRRFVDWMQERF